MVDPLPGFFAGTEMPVEQWWQALWPDPAGVLAAVGIEPAMDVIDLCAGDGWFTLPMARIARCVIAIDIDGAMIEATRSRLAAARLTNCRLVQGDAYALARLAPRPADFVFMANAFHGVPDKTRLTRVVRAALNAGGRFAVVNWHARPREETVLLGAPRGPATELRIGPEETIRTIEAGGLKQVTLVDLPPYHYGAVFAR